MLSPSASKTVVFDLGAVLLHWQPTEIVQHELPLHAPNTAAAQALCAGMWEPWAEFDRGTVEPAQLAYTLAAQSGLESADLLRFIHAIPNHLHTKQDTAALLPRLQAQGHRLVYLSNMPIPYADLLLERDFFDHFEDGIFSARVGLIKPEHGIYALAETQFGLTPADTVFIDDNAHNVATAHARGWQAIQFLDAAQCERDLVQLGWLEDNKA
ncbi:MAG: HAD family phosphatase [Rhodoferax sp.]|uniref:HAD family hydrolase n=1 Tax=Rhodoferax sp. TaxID=50421 RepID=UPI00326407B3